MSFIDSKERKDDLKLLICIILGFLFVAWLCTPPGNKLLQLCFWGNNTKMFFAKSTENEYIFHRNNAVYLAKLYPNDKKKTIKEMDKAIQSIPSNTKESEFLRLYRERAYINIYIGNYSAALNDFLRSGEIEFNDYLKMALLLKENGNYRYAEKYCNAILNQNPLAYAGYACLSEVYIAAGQPETALNIWILALDRKNNYPRFLIERAKVKKLLGDEKGYEEDINKAKTFDKYIDVEYSIINDTLKPKKLLLDIR